MPTRATPTPARSTIYLAAVTPRAMMLPMPHHVVVLALSEVVAFDLAIPAQVFGHRAELGRYTFTVCAERTGLVASTTGFAVRAGAGLGALAAADTVVVPGYWPADDPSPAVAHALQAAAAGGARLASVCTGAFALAAAGPDRAGPGRHAPPRRPGREEQRVRAGAVVGTRRDGMVASTVRGRPSRSGSPASISTSTTSSTSGSSSHQSTAPPSTSTMTTSASRSWLSPSAEARGRSSSSGRRTSGA